MNRNYLDEIIKLKREEYEKEIEKTVDKASVLDCFPSKPKGKE